MNVSYPDREFFFPRPPLASINTRAYHIRSQQHILHEQLPSGSPQHNDEAIMLLTWYTDGSKQLTRLSCSAWCQESDTAIMIGMKYGATSTCAELQGILEAVVHTSKDAPITIISDSQEAIALTTCHDKTTRQRMRRPALPKR